MSNRVLVVESTIAASLELSEAIQEELDIDLITSSSFYQTTQLLEEKKDIHVAIVEPQLDDDHDGMIVDLLIAHNIPVLVYTSDMTSDLFSRVINKPIVDYVIKSNRHHFDILIKLVGQILRHQKTSVLIIDDSASTRMLLTLMLDNLHLNILEADSVEVALELIRKHPEIKLLLADYKMQGQDGIDLTQEVRKKYSNKELSIIGLSSFGNPILSADFLKNGANDFISKPFEKEELINRVLLQLDMVDYIQGIKNTSEKDFLTGIYNRRYVYEVGRKLFENAKRGNVELACAMLDIDHFKKVNDTYGHDVGDKVIIKLAEILMHNFRKSDLVGRLGGEEFCVLLTEPDINNLEHIFDELRKKIAEIVISGTDEDGNSYEINFTVSIGVTITLDKSFEEMMKFADMKLYEAKNYGRNKVVI